MIRHDKANQFMGIWGISGDLYQGMWEICLWGIYGEYICHGQNMS